MAIRVKKGTWTFSTSSSPEQEAITGLGFTPKALIAWSTGPGAAGTITATSILSFGFATRRGGSTQARCICMWNQDNVGTTSASKEWTTALGVLLSAETTEDYNVTLVSFDDDGFTVETSNGTNSNGDIWHYIAIGGPDLEDAHVIEDDWPTSGGFSIVGFGFTPDAVIMLTGVGTAQGAGSVTSHAHMSIGAWGGGSAPTFVAATFAEDGQTMASNLNNNSVVSETAILCTVSQQATPSDTLDGVAGISTTESDGYTMGNTNAPAAAQRVFALGLKGMAADSDTKTQVTTAAADTYTGSNGAGMIPKLGLFVRSRGVTSGTVAVNAFGLMIGATDGTSDGLGMVQGVEAINSQSDRVHNTDCVSREIDTSNPPINIRKATFTSFGSDAVTITWDAASGGSYLVGCLMLGDKFAAGPVHRRPPMRQWPARVTAW